MQPVKRATGDELRLQTGAADDPDILLPRLQLRDQRVKVGAGGDRTAQGRCGVAKDDARDAGVGPVGRKLPDVVIGFAAHHHRAYFGDKALPAPIDIVERVKKLHPAVAGGGVTVKCCGHHAAQLCHGLPFVRDCHSINEHLFR